MNILVINGDLMMRVRFILLLDNGRNVVITAPNMPAGEGFLARWKADIILYAMPLECAAKLFCKEKPQETS